ncbi:propionate catabolism operon regulatory protein PrpR [Steroidobacter sp.]|uniref:propionate catabolism operon regulatory protein PrpR n=1 Tax=Steroidobacter sp. TaxID=1978227 RepID=UPI0032C223A4
MPATSLRKPKICVLSYHGLSALVHHVIPEFEQRADISVMEVAYHDALDLGREIKRRRQYDVIVTAGRNAALLRSALSFPVVSIKITGYDLLEALTKARAVSDHIGVVIYREKIRELEAIKDLLQVRVTQRTYESIEDGRACFQALHDQGLKVVVGSSRVVELANACGISGILVYSEDSVRQAFEEALQLAELAVLEAARYENLNTIVRCLHEAVLTVDSHHRITAINPLMERLLGTQAGSLLGRDLCEVDPGLSLENVLMDGETEVDSVVQYEGKSYVMTKSAIRELNVITGAILVLYDAQAIQRADVTVRSRRKSKGLQARYHFQQIVGISPALKQARAVAERCAKSQSTVLITGASGTGKELFAQAIHNASSRSNGPFVALNCAAFPESLLESELFGYEDGTFTGARKGGKPGLFESAHTGTLFLDEIGDMPTPLQTRLLRVLQEREVVRLGGLQPIPVDVRVIAATHCQLIERIREGKFRADLFYRLNILRLSLPALQERPEDIGPLALHLLQQSLRRQGCSLPVNQVLDPMLPVLLKYDWPGNVRELENIMERLAAYLASFEPGAEIDYEGFLLEAPELQGVGQQSEPTAAFALLANAPKLDTATVLNALERARGNKQLAADILGVSRTTLWRKLRDLQSAYPEASGA